MFTWLFIHMHWGHSVRGRRKTRGLTFDPVPRSWDIFILLNEVSNNNNEEIDHFYIKLEALVEGKTNTN